MDPHFEFRWDVVAQRWDWLASGLGITVYLTVVSMAVALVLGLIIALLRMAKFRPVKGKKPRATGPPPGGLACVVLVILAMVLVMVFLYLAMRNPG